ncbi:MAG: hypothetical protein IID32_10285, partial [Planctomycetes bacterium]|nr:hypothetical protein [Planctomycetota bacterium]
LTGCYTGSSLTLQKSFDEIHIGQTTSTEVLNLLPEEGMLHTAESVSLLIANGWTKELGIVRFSPTESVVLRTDYLHHRSKIATPPYTKENLLLVIKTTLPDDLLNEPYENEMRKFLAILEFYQSSLIDDARPFEQDQQTLSMIGLGRAALSTAIWNLSNNPRRTSEITSQNGFSFIHPTLGKSNLTIEEHADGIYTLTLTATATVDPYKTW